VEQNGQSCGESRHWAQSLAAQIGENGAGLQARRSEGGLCRRAGLLRCEELVGALPCTNTRYFSKDVAPGLRAGDHSSVVVVIHQRHPEHWIGLKPRRVCSELRKRTIPADDDKLSFRISVARCVSIVLRLMLSLTLAKISTGSAVARHAEHRIVLDDLMGALEHELHAPEVAERRPATLGV
jgi:hypothetical protein